MVAASVVELDLARLLVALDDSSAADRALAFALELCGRFASELVLCTVLDHERERAADAMPDAVVPSIARMMANYDDAATALLRGASARALAAGVRSSSIVLEGRTAVAIAACANERGAGAIVMGTRGKTAMARTFVGSTANGVLRLADVPVFVISDRSDERANGTLEIERILVALDDSEASAAALAFALRLSDPRKTVLLCCYVVDTGQLVDNSAIYGCDPEPFVREVRDAARKLVAEKTVAVENRVRAIERLVLEGSAADVILEAAAERHADLILCGTHGRRGLQRFFLGSVAENVVRRSSVPVAVVRS